MHEALNHAKLAMLFRKEFELCNVRKGETVVLLSDLGARRDYVAAAFAAAEEFGADAYEMCVNAMPSWTKVGVETVGRCKGTLEAIKAADMLVCLHIPLFTRWLKEARDAGTRVLMVIDGPDELEELMAPPGLSIVCFRFVDRSIVDEETIAAVNRTLLEKLQLGGEAFLTSTELRGRYVLRACFVNDRSTRSDVDRMLKAVRAIGQEITLRNE